MKTKVMAINAKGMNAGRLASILSTMDDVYDKPTVDVLADGTLGVYLRTWQDGDK